MNPDLVIILIGVFLIGIIIGICIGGAIEYAAREESDAFLKMSSACRKMADAKRDLGNHFDTDDAEHTP